MKPEDRIQFLCSLFKGQHMQPQICDKDYHWFVVYQELGDSYCFPRDTPPYVGDGGVLGEFSEPCYLFRWSAPGYLDCTDWTPKASLEAIIEALEDEIYEQGDAEIYRKAGL